MEDKLNIEQISMELIVNSGEARGLAFEALKKAKSRKFEEAKALLERSEKSSLVAHKAQSKLLFNESNGNTTEMSVLLVHAQDHLMTSILAQELIKEIIELHECKEDR
ncbi:N,N'-diacetylchitobiose-specific phosphotransferase enzyme IIA component [compost metagenome]